MVGEHRDSGEGAAAPLFVAPDASADVAVVIVTRNSARHISDLIADLRVAAHDLSLRVVIVDNESVDDTVDLVRRHADVILIESGGNLGYGGGLNVGIRAAGKCAAVLILNPDLRLSPGSVLRLRDVVVRDADVGAVVPLIRNDDGTTYHSLHREPSLMSAYFDALLGGKLKTRPSFTSGTYFNPASYGSPRDVDWGSGAALLVPADVVEDVGPWWDEYPIYSEETDYFRRIRELGRKVRFEPSAVVTHIGGGSGRTLGLYALMEVNRIRYVERYHGRIYTGAFRAAVVLREALRSYNKDHRYAFGIVRDRKRWDSLPRISKPCL